MSGGLVQEWNIQIVDTIHTSGGYGVAFILDSTDKAHISYYDGIQGVLKYAKWTGSEWNLIVVDSLEYYRNFGTSLALDSSGHPHIIYGVGYGNPPTTPAESFLNYAWFNGTHWIIQRIAPLYGIYGYFDYSIALIHG